MRPSVVSQAVYFKAKKLMLDGKGGGKGGGKGSVGETPGTPLSFAQAVRHVAAASRSGITAPSYNVYENPLPTVRACGKALNRSGALGVEGTPMAAAARKKQKATLWQRARAIFGARGSE